VGVFRRGRWKGVLVGVSSIVNCALGVGGLVP
jgi:hypothetical protein